MSLKDYIIKSGKLPKKNTNTLTEERVTEIFNRAIKAERAIVDTILKAKELGIEDMTRSEAEAYLKKKEEQEKKDREKKEK